MEITIKGEAKEIAALVFAVQERQKSDISISSSITFADKELEKIASIIRGAKRDALSGKNPSVSFV